MKTITRIATKIAGTALATAMLLGGATVFAAETADQGYSDSFSVKARRSHALVYFNYTGDNKTMTVSESGYYSIDFSAQNPGDYPKELFITNETTRESITSVSGPWNSYSIPGVYLEAGTEYGVSVYADDFMGFTILEDSGSREFTVTATLESKPEAEEAEIPSMPEIVIDEAPVLFDMYVDLSSEKQDEEVPAIPETAADKEDEEPAAVDTVIDVDIDVDADIEDILPSASILTPDQIRTLSVKNFVGHLYLEGLGRQASEEELNYWVESLSCCRITATEAAAQILTSAEFKGQDNNNEQLAAILNNVFNTKAAEDTLAQLNDGASVSSVIEQLADSDDWASKCAFYGVNV